MQLISKWSNFYNKMQFTHFIKKYKNIFSPEASKTRNDIFYLQPERSCVPDSPVWYTCNPLNAHQLDKMLQRLLMIREVQEMMLADSNEN